MPFAVPVDKDQMEPAALGRNRVQTSQLLCGDPLA
jgi:hypothetical protein